MIRILRIVLQFISLRSTCRRIGDLPALVLVKRNGLSCFLY
jgi:hypothetical protein